MWLRIKLDTTVRRRGRWHFLHMYINHWSKVDTIIDKVPGVRTQLEKKENKTQDDIAA